jgi:hypothetical protein
MFLLTKAFIVGAVSVIELADNSVLGKEDTSVTNWGQSLGIYTILFAGPGPRYRLGQDLPLYLPPAIWSVLLKVDV